MLAQQAQQVLLEANRNAASGSPVMNQQSSPPQGGGVGNATPNTAPPSGTHIVPQDEEGLWGAANRTWKQQMVS